MFLSEFPFLNELLCLLCDQNGRIVELSQGLKNSFPGLSAIESSLLEEHVTTQTTQGDYLDFSAFSANAYFKYSFASFKEKLKLVILVDFSEELNLISKTKELESQFESQEKEFVSIVDQLFEKQQELESNKKQLQEITQVIDQQSKALMQLANNPDIQNGRWKEVIELVGTQAFVYMSVERLSIWEANKHGILLCTFNNTANHVDHDVIGKRIDLHDHTFLNDQLLKGEIWDSYSVEPQEKAIISELIFGDVLDREVLIIPYLVNQRVGGALCIVNKNLDHFAIQDINFAKSLTDLLAVAWNTSERKKDEEKIKHMFKQLQVSEEELRQNMEELQAINEVVHVQKAKLNEQNHRMTQSINYALTIQKAILPSKRYRHLVFPQSFVLYLPKDIVSGDFFWISQHDSTRIVSAIDCTGHGVPGAFMSLIGHSIMSELIWHKEIFDPAEVLNQMHKLVRRRLNQEDGANNDGMDLSICALTPNGSGGFTLVAAAAKHRIYVLKEGELIFIDGDRFSIGGANTEPTRNYKSNRLELMPGDRVFLMTDGYVDQCNRQRKRIGSARLAEIIRNTSDWPVSKYEELKAKFAEILDEHQDGEEQRDDITVFSFVV